MIAITRILLLICAWLAAFSSAFAADTPRSLFEQGNILYGNSQYEDALQKYLAATDEVQSSALHLNIGNAYFQLGRFGHAILHYRKALALDPNNADARANLSFAQRNAGLQPDSLSRTDRFAAAFSFKAWCWAAAIAGWFALFAWILPRYFSGPSIITRLIATCALIVACAAGFAVFSLLPSLRAAVVLESDTPLRLAPTSGSPAALVLPAGASVTLGEAVRDFVHVTTPTGESGFLQTSEFASVWPRD